MTETGGGATASASIEVLRKLKEIETELDARLVAARAQSAQQLAKAREAADLAVGVARAEADRWREVTLVAARSQAQIDSDKILADGRREAATLEQSDVTASKSTTQKVLDAVLSGFRASDSGGK
jgi:vacuolar-type H+-ATPase subunit H